jgi:serine/threonine-protein kinase HipA
LLLFYPKGECAGAVTFLEPGQALPVPTRSDDVQWLSDQEVVAILDELPRRPMLVEHINTLIELRCAQTIRRLTDPADENDAAAEPSV